MRWIITIGIVGFLGFASYMLFAQGPELARPVTPNTAQAERAKALREIEANPTEDSLRRRERSNAIITELKVPLNKTLPVIQSEMATELRSSDEALIRALATMMVSAKALGAEQADLSRMIRDFDLAASFTPSEREFIRTAAPSAADKAKHSWQCEAAYVLFWANGFFDDLGPPKQSIDPQIIFDLLLKHDLKWFRANAKLRSKAQILDQADLIYRYRWALEEARVTATPRPKGLDADVAQERHYALNWLISYMGEDWDDVSTDT